MGTYYVKMFNYFPNEALFLYQGWELGVATSTEVIEQTWAIGRLFVISKHVYCNSYMPQSKELKRVEIDG